MGIYSDYIFLLSPPWLKEGKAKDLLEGYGNVLDQEGVGRVIEAMKAHIVEKAPIDVLPTLARERSLERFPTMNEEDFRNYLRAVWQTWLFGGTQKGVLAALQTALSSPRYTVLC